MKSKPPKKEKTIAFAIPTGGIARFLLRSGLPERLLQAGFHLLILTPNSDEEYFRREFERPGVHIEKLELEKMNRYSKRRMAQSLLRRLRYYGMSDLSTIRFKYEEYWLARRRRTIQGWFFDTAVKLFHRSITARKLFLALERWLFAPRFHREIFERYQPDLVVCGSMGFERFPHDAYMLWEAESQGIKTLVVITSWDHPTSKGWRGAVPDYTAVWSEVMKKELVEYHQYPAGRCFVTGPLLFDVHYREPAFLREEFLQRMGLDPQRKTLLFYTWQPELYPYHSDIIRILGEAMKNGAFTRKVQLMVRLHFLWFRSSTHNTVADDFIALCKSYPDVYIDRSPVLSAKLRLDTHTSENERLSALIRYSDIMLSLGSTARLEASIHDVPVIDIHFNGLAGDPVDPAKDYRRTKKYSHNARFLETGAARAANSPEELIRLINMYLENPALDGDNRRRAVIEECGFNDGGNIDRFVSLVKEVLRDSTTQ